MDRVSVTSLLGARDLDELRLVVDEVADDGLTPDDEVSISRVLADWTDVQAIANVLMYPAFIPSDARRDYLVRGLSASEPYLRLAAAVGVGQVRAAAWSEEDVAALVPPLIELVAHDNDVTASRAALSLVPLARQTDAPELASLLGHRDSSVRRNLEASLLRSVGPDGITAILDGGFLDEGSAGRARAALADDGVDLGKPAEELRLLPASAYIPNYSDWSGTD